MDLRIAGFTKMADKITHEDMEQLKTHCGKNAGISQCRETFVNEQVADPGKARKRFDTTMKRRHYSIADHAQVEVVFEKASRMMAMIMNSLQYNATTEKSGRYTKMKGDDEPQQALYDKWNAIFKKRVLELYPDYNDKFVNMQLKKRGFEETVKNGRLESQNKDTELHKALEEIYAMASLPVNTRSQENARYVLSIFTKSTAFGYTTSLAQWNYIYDWCNKYLEQFFKRDGEYWKKAKWGIIPATEFEKNIAHDLSELAAFIRENLYVDDLRDHKLRCFDILNELTDENHPMQLFDPGKDNRIGFSYTQSYEGSFILLSHLHRHRTIKYWMQFDEEAGFYVPKPIKGTKYEQEWLDDLEKVRHLYPQGMLINIIEAGTLDTFAQKTSERFCGCAMSETMENVKAVAEKFVHWAKSGEASEMEKKYIEKFYDFENDRFKTKAEITDGCVEGCYFGCARALERDA